MDYDPLHPWTKFQLKKKFSIGQVLLGQIKESMRSPKSGGQKSANDWPGDHSKIALERSLNLGDEVSSPIES
jgi:hypothetical protein